MVELITMHLTSEQQAEHPFAGQNTQHTRVDSIISHIIV